MRTFVIGDIHGAHKALVQCLERSGFDRARDRLIALGDVCDGYPDVKRSIDELLTLEHCDYIIGNHDLWALQWAQDGTETSLWLNQGGENTITSYEGADVPLRHIEFLSSAHWFVETGKQLFVHGGIDPKRPVGQHDPDFLVWDRSLVQDAWFKAQKDPQYRFSTYEKIFVGHTPTQKFNWLRRADITKPRRPDELRDDPLFLCNVVMMDTGAGWSGRLTIMDIETLQYWQSDPTPSLYGGQARPPFD